MDSSVIIGLVYSFEYIVKYNTLEYRVIKGERERGSKLVGGFCPLIVS